MSKEKLFPIIILALCIASRSFSQTSIRIQSGTTVKLSPGVVMTLTDMDLINDGELNAAAGDGRIIFSGSGNNRIGGSSISSFDELEMAKANSSSLLLEQDLQIRGAIRFTSGLINLNNHNISLFGNASLQNESENSRITGVNGYVQLSMQLNNPQSVNPGNLGATISSAQNMGLTTIRRGHQSQLNASGTGNSIFRYYDIIPANNTALDATLRIQYFNAELNTLDENILVLWKSINNSDWTEEGFTSRDIAMNYVEKTGIAGFSRWTLSSIGNALPVRGLKLSGRWKNNAALLDWTTIAEYNNRYFNIERKYSNENDFSIVGVKNSNHADGNAQSPTSYKWKDPADANKGPISYRLKQVDRDGRSAYSKVITIKPEALEIFIKNLYPTQKTGSYLYVQTGDLNLGEMHISIYDMQGRQFLKRKTSYSAQRIDLPSLAAGMYQLVIESGEWRYTGKFIKE